MLKGEQLRLTVHKAQSQRTRALSEFFFSQRVRDVSNAQIVDQSRISARESHAAIAKELLLQRPYHVGVPLGCSDSQGHPHLLAFVIGRKSGLC